VHPDGQEQADAHERHDEGAVPPAGDTAGREGGERDEEGGRQQQRGGLVRPARTHPGADGVVAVEEPVAEPAQHLLRR
jgi:hypothetical protein